MLSLPDHPVLFPGSAGILDGAGMAGGAVNMPADVLTPLHGWCMRYAAIVYPAALLPMRATNAVEVALAR